MTSHKLHLIRHAAHQGAGDGKYIGHTDIPISKSGEKELKSILEDFGPYPSVDVLISSPLKRALKTAEIIYPDKKPIIMNDFSEYNFGEFEGQTAENLKEDKAFISFISGKNPDIPVPFGESQNDFNKRVCTGFIKLINGILLSKTKNTAIITHGGVIMELMTAFAIPIKPMHEWITPNCCGYTLRIDTKIWMRMQKLEVFNNLPCHPLTPDEDIKLWDYYKNPFDNEEK
ncbi:MAG: histidine phosphatase family protein [Candidatus Fimenecus sp.]